MRLYLSQNGIWTGTQADARKHGSFEQVDVPTDKAGLLAWLNNMAAGNGPADTIVDDGDEPEFAGNHTPPAREATTNAQPTGPERLSPDAVVDWVLDGASNAQVEQLFTALGTRFHERAK